MTNARLLFLRWFPTLALILAGLIFINLIWLVPTVRSIRSSASILALEIAERIRVQITAELETALNEVKNAADEIAFEPARREVALKLLFKRNPNLRTLAIADRSGHEVIRFDRFRLVTSEDLRDHSRDSHFYLALEGASNFGLITVTQGLEPQTVLAVPIPRLGGAAGTREVLIAELNLRSLVSAARTLKIERGHVYVVDKEGFQIVHPDLTEILKRRNFSTRAIVQKVIVDGRVADGLSVNDTYVNDEGERVFVVGIPVPIARLGLFVEQPRVQAFAGERQMILFAVMTVFLGMGVFMLMIRGNVRLSGLNAQLRSLLSELDSVGKMLVRRDLELTRANTRLEELDQVKSEFVSIAAHQLRTPLTVLRWSYDMLLEEQIGKLSIEQRKVVVAASKTSRMMAELVNDLLNVARIEEGRVALHFAEKSITDLVRKVAAGAKAASTEKGITFLLEGAEQELPPVAMDEEKLSMVLENLLDNAVKYTVPGGTVRVTIQLLPAKGMVAIEITDTGIGIPKNQLHRLFTKFFRADNALLFQTSGSGLGLYIVKNIIENHKGTVFGVSEEGKGSTFRIELPVARNHNAVS